MTNLEDYEDVLKKWNSQSTSCRKDQKWRAITTVFFLLSQQVEATCLKVHHDLLGHKKTSRPGSIHHTAWICSLLTFGSFPRGNTCFRGKIWVQRWVIGRHSGCPRGPFQTQLGLRYEGVGEATGLVAGGQWRLRRKIVLQRFPTLSDKKRMTFSAVITFPWNPLRCFQLRPWRQQWPGR